MKGEMHMNEVNLKDLYEQSFRPLKDGDIVSGTIVAVNQNEVLVDVGYKSEGVIPLGEFLGDERKVGRDIEVYIQAIEDENGTISLSRDKAKRLKGWDTITKDVKENDFVKGVVTKKVKGGYMVSVMGIEAFLPASLSMFRKLTDSEVLNNEFMFKLVKINYLRKNLIVSRREAIQKEREEVRDKLWQSLQQGEIRSGLVKGIADFGVFVDLGGVDGLLHITDMSWSKINHPSEMVAIGDRIEVAILNVDRDNKKVSLGLKQRLPDPWVDIEVKYPLGSKVKGAVVNIVAYGIFVEIEKGIEGLVHVSEMSWSKKSVNPHDLFAVGDAVEVNVVNIDKESRRIALSIKQLEQNPWLEAKSKYPVGSKVMGKVRGFADYGAFIELDANLEGMIHVSDLSWTKRVGHPQDVLKKGQRIEVAVLAVDQDAQKISLGLKQMSENPWSSIATRYPIGTSLEVEVVNVTDFGVFVKIAEDLEGLIYSSEIDREASKSLKAGDRLTAKIIKVDVDQAKIGLSAKLE
jgi:small subunit ribosomal protein S1